MQRQRMVQLRQQRRTFSFVMEPLPVIVVEDVAPAPTSEPQMIEEVIDAPKCARQPEEPKDMQRQQRRRNNKSADLRTRQPSPRRVGSRERVAV